MSEQMSEITKEIEKLIAFLKDPNHLYIYNLIEDIKQLNDKIEKEKKKPLMDIEPPGLPWYEQRHNDSDAYDSYAFSDNNLKIYK